MGDRRLLVWVLGVVRSDKWRNPFLEDFEAKDAERFSVLAGDFENATRLSSCVRQPENAFIPFLLPISNNHRQKFKSHSSP